MKKILSVSLLFLWFISTYSQPVTSAQIDKLVEQTMKAFDVPGIAVAVVRDGKVIHSKGYGVRSIVTGEKTNENTLFAIASNTKAFTAAALGILIDEGKLSWDSKVSDIIPEFRLYDAYVTEDFNIKDLLTHRSGMGLGAGDLMIWPDSASFSKEDLIHNVRYLRQASSFRTKYDYDNLLYIVAGEVVARVSGTSWEEFVESKIMVPLGMTVSGASIGRLKDRSNIIDAHVPVVGKLQVVPKHEGSLHNPAGGIMSSVADMSKWVIMQINNGKYGPDLERQIFSEKVHDEMWTPQTIIPVRGKTTYNTHFAGYGLGWRLADEKGYKVVGHTGSLQGVVTQVTIIPEMKLGIIVFTNQQSDDAYNAITNTIKDSYYGMSGFDRITEYKEQVMKSQKNAMALTEAVWKTIEEQQKTNQGIIDLAPFTGTYSDVWFGDVIISLKNGKLWFTAVRSPKLSGEMIYYKGNTFIVRWRDRTLDADAFAVFSLDREGIPSGIKMEAVSPLTDFSFDFQDLEFHKKD
ncbi:MAG TPA: serine hydrolase [Bacteroidales bacterium]|nr:serine hydrolase [Bacteroidales bacterium]